MDYYEELGISPSATLDEIHRAHRRLSKLLQPDQQTGRAMKLIAEPQMRRLNAIVKILSDPELRHQDDAQLKGTAIIQVVDRETRTPRMNHINFGVAWSWRRRFLPWWLWTPLGAAILDLFVVSVLGR
jgi:curved DNA-binding protein CbpA